MEKLHNLHCISSSRKAAGKGNVTIFVASA